MLLKIEIIKKNIIENLKKIKDINNNLICILKDDAYGLGIKNILPILVENNCLNYGVAYVEEGILIRNIIKKKYPEKLEKIKIIVLNYIEVGNLKKAIENDIEITLFNIFQLDDYINKIKHLKINKRIIFHLKFNIGMNRLGFDYSEIDNLIERINFMKKNKFNFKIDSVYSHISNSEDLVESEKQIDLYNKIIEKLIKNGLDFKYKHIQASPLMFQYGKKYNYDYARIGMAIYGMEPLSKKVGLKQSVNVISKVINIRNVKKGDKISYGDKGILEEDKKVAVVAVGYAHGLQKQIENVEGYVLINGKRADILGEVCMDMIIVDISNIKNVKIGNRVTIIGRDSTEEITLLEMSNWSNTIQDDILTNWNKDIKKIII